MRSGIISTISPATKIKEDARAAVEAKAIAQNQQINSNNMATTEEKQDALNQVEAHKQATIAISIKLSQLNKFLKLRIMA